MRSISTIAACCLLPAAALAQVQPGPGSWSANQTWAADTVNGGNLTGFVYWPSVPPALGGKRALVLVLHGCAQTAASDVIDSATDGGFNWKRAADQYGAVILAPNATGNVYGSHCWDYASTSHKRTSGHDGVLLDLVHRFVSHPQYGIDPKQVYVTGLSSGGGQAMALGCLAPDIFAGLGINAGPPPGTTTGQIGFVPSGYSAATAANQCRNLAGANAPFFATQISSVVWGTSDYTVAQAYGPMDAAAMRLVYGGTFTKGAPVAVTPGGSNIFHTDAGGKVRTAEMSVTGQGHAWPAGAGGQATHFVDASKVNYPAFVMDFWFRHNARVSTVAAPVMTACSATVSGTTATVSGAAMDQAGPVSSYRVQLSGATPVDDGAAGSGASFSKGYALAHGYYTGSVSATNAATGQVSAACQLPQFLVGTAPALPPPAGLTVTARGATSISLAWTAVQGAGGYHVYRDGSRITAAPVSTTSHTAGGLADSTAYRFQVSAVGAAGEGGLSAAVSASTTSGFICTATSASNYAHVQAGRAYASGGYAYARGSGQNMGLNNTFYIRTLAQTSPAYYLIGHCPAP
ncbi:PHB depolymerase family esterase [Massilia sp. PAMC28688]|uniref:extracellular catalytic domain type 1 short-chain-length polyhydroxyalkanoate depolymerase n=1 Tax=Massilia sp. PAMC28688 TaxID=2861283 RepID=UPI001C62B19F|nr:PHB depolymerase family esterase [Massilia sp. PAMC28688]QYF95349.1 PHB depolymerase family esterase [Massilia sp. PAMC28688]